MSTVIWKTLHLGTPLTYPFCWRDGERRLPPDYANWFPTSQFLEAFPQRNRASSSYMLHNTLGMIPGSPTTLDLRQKVRVPCAPSYLSEVHIPELIDILENYVSQDTPLITHVLFNQVRPVFQSHVHPKVNPSTGRVLSRVAGGPLASQDLYTSQSWKESHPGISNVLFWIVARIKVKTSYVARCAYT